MTATRVVVFDPKRSDDFGHRFDLDLPAGVTPENLAGHLRELQTDMHDRNNASTSENPLIGDPS